MMKKYTKSHEWIEEQEDGTILIGLSDYAQGELGDIVFIKLPDAGITVKVDEAIAEVESVKAVSEIYSPVAGIITEVNEELLANPAKINEDAVNTWLFKAKDVSAFTELLEESEYLSIVS